jgi:methylmalonyl-CoA/ethylmalonyl-CoA epimerase
MKPFESIACVSIAVPSIAAALPAYTKGLGLQVVHDIQTSQRGFGMRWIELGHGGQTFLELLEPTGDDGPVASFLRKGGASKVYQIRFAVDDLDEALATLESRGMRIIRGKDLPSQPRVGWVHPSSTGGVLFELVQFVPPA